MRFHTRGLRRTHRLLCVIPVLCAEPGQTNESSWELEESDGDDRHWPRLYFRRLAVPETRDAKGRFFPVDG